MLAGLALALLVLITLMYRGRGYLAWTMGLGIFLIGWRIGGVGPELLWWLLLLAGVALGLLFGYRPWRIQWVSEPVMKKMAGALPRIGDTEREALEAGTVWWDAELFSGNPDWDWLLRFQVQPLSEREQAFIDGPVEDVCRMVDEWDVAQNRDLSEEAWEFLREQGFFGMIIPEQYGGLGFSAIGHSRVVTKLASRSVTLAVTVMVPNSLGPAELLLQYGTELQRKHYLPRLASGEEIPCFALTGPESGSDAAATQSTGIVTRGEYQGENVLGMRLNWKKRYITLAPIATVIGLAFRLLDPDHLLGEEEDLGITCALIPADIPGVEIGRRHDPLGIPFHNGPTEGKDVFVPLEHIIGGRERAGEGWKMLMNSLAAGRSVSLPALAVGAVQMAARVVGAYGTVREQFDTPIGRFEGVEELMAPIAAHAYFMSAARTLTCGALDAGEHPSVISAIMKAYLTEGMRQCINHAMDIRAGAAIQRGPRNILARIYQSVPIAITVEGSNVLTRSMIIYGQGAIRCHPHIQDEISAVQEDDVDRFDRAFFAHVNLICRNATRAWVLGVTGSRLETGHVNARVAPYFRHLSRFSAAFAVTSDVCMLSLGGKLKRREKISGRLADCLAWLYLASAALKRYAEDWQKTDDLPLLSWTCEYALFQMQSALDGVCQNLDRPLLGRVLRWVILPYGLRRRPPGDRLGSDVARSLLGDRAERQRVTSDIFIPPADEPGLGRLEDALDHAVAAIQVETKLRDAVRAGLIDKAPGTQLAENGLKAGIITDEDYERLVAADACRQEVIQVDSFTKRQYARLKG